VKEIEKRDSVLTSKQQLDRLLRPGASYFNLNPYEVLQLDPETPLDEAKKKYKRVRSCKDILDADAILSTFFLVCLKAV